MTPAKESLRARWLRRGLDTHVSLPLFALLLLVAIWVVTFHEIDAEREHAQEAATDSLQEMLGTYEAQVARSLDGIDQTLRMLKYAVERKGRWAPCRNWAAKACCRRAWCSWSASSTATA
jgi:sensor domain CHASE-containing protein